MFYVTTLALLIIFLTTIYWYLKHKYFTTFNLIHKIPGPKPEWFFGNLRNTGIMRGEKPTYEVLAELKRLYGDVFSFWFGSFYTIVLSRLEHVQHVLADKQTYDLSDIVINSGSTFFPTGLACLRGNEWKRHSHIMRPILRRTKIITYFDTILDCVDRCINECFVHHDGSIHTNLTEHFQYLMLSMNARILFDCDPEDLSSTGHDIQQAFGDYLRYGAILLLKVVYPHFITKLYLTLHWKFQRARRIVKRYMMQNIKEEQNRQEQKISAKSNKPRSLMVSLWAAIEEESASSRRASLTSNEIFDDIMLIKLAAFETTTSMLCWFVFYMSKHPTIQQKMKDEIKDHDLTQETLDSLVYVDCVVKELLRFARTDAFIARQVIRDDMIGDISVKKDDIILIALQNLHRDPRYWNVDPSKFMPERFLDEDKSPPHGAYMPFSGGHRACPGQDLGFFQLKIVIARLMQRVTFEDPGDEANNSGGCFERLNCFPKHLAIRVRLDSDKITG
jgi:cytochrome P450